MSISYSEIVRLQNASNFLKFKSKVFKIKDNQYIEIFLVLLRLFSFKKINCFICFIDLSIYFRA